MELKKVRVADIKPYPNNPRRNDEAVDAVAESIRQCGYCAPIVVDENMVILAGHTRHKALQKLGMMDCEVVIKSGLNDAQKRKYRLLDNKTGEVAEWDLDSLKEELDGLDFEGFDFGFDELVEDVGSGNTDPNKYTDKVNIPQYEPNDTNYEPFDLVNTNKVNQLIEEIRASSVTEDEKEFLTIAAYRHAEIEFDRVADYYAKASKEMQTLMERSALVIIDIDNAIANGYTTLTQSLDDLMEADVEE